MIELLVGPISSGKSTYSKVRAQEGAVTVNDDAIVMAVHGQEYKLYDPSYKPLYKSISTHMATVATLSAHDVVIDGTNLTVARRARWIDFAKCMNTDIIVVMFPWEPAAVHAERRMAHDSRGYTLEKWTEVADRHEAEFEPLTTEEVEHYSEVLHYPGGVMF